MSSLSVSVIPSPTLSGSQYSSEPSVKTLRSLAKILSFRVVSIKICQMKKCLKVCDIAYHWWKTSAPVQHENTSGVEFASGVE